MSEKSDFQIKDGKLKKYIGSSAEVTIPDDVVIIGKYCFSGHDEITKITIPDSVEETEYDVFKDCSNLRSINIPASIKVIGARAFMNCNSLNSVCVEDIAAWCEIHFVTEESNPIYYAGNIVVEGERVTDLVIPEGVTSIDQYAFIYLKDLESVTIPTSMETIGKEAFLCVCKKVCINDLERWCKISFWDADSNPLAGGLVGADLYLDGKLVSELLIPDGVTSINESAFQTCNSLTSLSLPDSVTEIGEYAFFDCDNLRSVSIPNSVTKIGAAAFNCWNLSDITIPDSVVEIEDSLFDEEETMCSDRTTIHARAGSVAEKYAKENNIPFKALD